MFCKYCGRQIADDSKFCEFCGNLVQRSVEEPTPDIPASIGEPIFKEIVSEPMVTEEPEEDITFVPKAVQEEQTEEQPTQEPEQEAKKKPKVGLIVGLACGAVALIALIVFIIVTALGGKPATINVTTFADFTVSGYEGYGKATCEVDWDSLELAVLGEYPSGSDSKTRQKQLEYKELAALLKSAVKLNFEEKNGVSVGDVLIAEFELDESVEKELNIEFSNVRRVEYTVTDKDLDGSTTIDVLGEFADVTFTGFSGKATAALTPKERDKDYTFTSVDGTEYVITMDVEDEDTLLIKLHNDADGSTEMLDVEYELDKAKDISEGDKVTLTLDKSAESTLMEYGLVPKNYSAEFTAMGLQTLITSFTELDGATLQGWKAEYAESLKNNIVANWADYFHAGNQIASTVMTAETEWVQSALSVKEGQSNALYLIYTADVTDDAILLSNGGMPLTYYFAVCISDMRLDSEGKLVSETLILPNEDGVYGPYESMDALAKDLLGTSTNVTYEN